MRVILVDDEAPARTILREYLQGEKEIRIVAECENGFEAVKAVAEHRPDLLFLDVQMPKLNGFEVLELLDPQPAVVFTTAYDQYALKAFEVHAIDYLLKPFSRERFQEALRKVQEKGSPVTKRTSARDLLETARVPDSFLDRILVKAGSSIHVLPVDRLDYLEAKDDYVAIHAEGEVHLKKETLGALAKQLNPRRFVRIHRSYILHLDCLAEVQLYAKDSRLVILVDGTKLPVSRSGYARLKELL
ncbi:MAG: DNA-binding response regulator [Planctomycetota bacterium]|nr:MAG: DNA-binding response regulator [Planctomycetota bacterium]